jgi:hypothetical protein
MQRETTMSDEKVLCSHVLTIRFDQLEGNRVNWYLEPDEQVSATDTLDMVDLAECGAPLAAMGIHALWRLCADGLVYSALEQATGYRRRSTGACSPAARCRYWTGRLGE